MTINDDNNGRRAVRRLLLYEFFSFFSSLSYLLIMYLGTYLPTYPRPSARPAVRSRRRRANRTEADDGRRFGFVTLFSRIQMFTVTSPFVCAPQQPPPRT